MSLDATVCVVDDDEQVRKSLRFLIEPLGIEVLEYASAREFLERCDPHCTGCLVLDVRMPEMSGLDLQERMAAREITLPIIFISGHADVPMSVRAMKAGAFDFLVKPFNHQALIDRIQQAIARDRETRLERANRTVLSARLTLLSEREREVMDLALAGKTNKLIADRLGITVRTVEAHRAKIMEKMRAGSMIELVRMLAPLRI
jgi:two-component system, LuxR family, response regulator FixJ